MTRHPAAYTAFGPIAVTAVEQNEPADRRLVEDDLAELFLPIPVRLLIATTQWRAVRRALVRASERAGHGLWANLACRKRYIGDKLAEAIDDVDAVVILGAGLDTRAYRLTRQVRKPVFEVDLPVNIARKAKTVRRVLGELPLSVRLVALDFEHDDLLTALAEHGYRTDYRTFFVWEGVTQYLTEQAVRTTLEGLRATAPGSRLVFSYVRRSFIDGTDRFGARALYRKVRKRKQLWHFGIEPGDVAPLLAEYGWRLAEQVGPDDLTERYVRPAGRNLPTSQIEWSAYAEKI